MVDPANLDSENLKKFMELVDKDSAKLIEKSSKGIIDGVFNEDKARDLLRLVFNAGFSCALNRFIELTQDMGLGEERVIPLNALELGRMITGNLETKLRRRDSTN